MEEPFNKKYDARLDHLLNESFKQNWNRIAVHDATKSVTYSVLESTIRKLSCEIPQALSLDPESGTNNVIGLLFSNNLDLLVAILTCKAKRIPYLVLDSNSPLERTRFILRNSGVLKCLTDTESREKVDNTEFIYFPVELLEFAQQDNNKALFEERSRDYWVYSIYTSGTTGKPKGINHTWGELEDNINSMIQLHPIPTHANILQLSPFHSDPSRRQILWPLSQGASLTIVPPSIRSQIDEWTALICKYNVTDMFILPNMLNTFLVYVESTRELIAKIPLERIFCAGEPLLKSTAARLHSLFPNVKCFNQYGVSEISGNLTSYEVDFSNCLESDDNGAYVKIGKILDHIEFFLIPPEEVDSNASEMKEGILAAHSRSMPGCYVNNIESEKFIERDGKKYFITGDVVQINGDGNLCVRGRKDFQVKIVGYRVELLEIEAVLSSAEEVEEACVIVSTEPSGQIPIIKAFYTEKDLNNQGRTIDAIRNHLSDYLPSYMMPAVITKLNCFPRLPNGKVDRRALQEITRAGDQPEKNVGNYFLTKTEEKVLAAFRNIFPHATKLINLETDFFEMGGNSLLTFHLSRLLTMNFEQKICSKLIYEKRTVSAIAQSIQRYRLPETTDPNPPGIQLKCTSDQDESRDAPFPLTPMQTAYLVGREDPTELPIHDYLEFSCKPLTFCHLSASLNKVIKRHPMLRSVVVDLEDGNKAQAVLDEVPVVLIKRYNLKEDTEKEVESHLESIRNEMSHQVFDLRTFPQFDVRFTQTRACDYVHLSFDGFFFDAKSFEIVLKDWSFYYTNSADAILPPLNFSFKEYTLTLGEFKKSHSELYARDEQYWKDKILSNSFPPGPTLPTLTLDELNKTQCSREVDAIPPEAWHQIQEYIKNDLQCSTNVFLVTIFAQVLSRYCSSPNFALNLTVNNRIPLHEHVQDLVGNFTSNLLLEFNDNIAGKSLQSEFTQVQERYSNDLEHSLFSGLEVQRLLMSHTGRSDCNFPVVFTNLLQVDRHYQKYLFGGNVLSTSYHITQTPQLVIDCKVYEDERGLVLEWDYLEGKFEPGLVSEMHSIFVKQVKNFGAPVVNEDDDENVFTQNKPAEEKLNSCLLHELFFKSVQNQQQTGQELLAVVSQSRRISYVELSDMVLTAARNLKALGLNNGEIVGICMEKGWEQVVATLAILASGGVYVPIDPNWPSSRLQNVLKICDLKKVIVSHNSSCQNLPKNYEEFSIKNCDFIHIDQLLLSSTEEFVTQQNLEQISRSPDDIAYIIFTSGTTGVPKGVSISHRGAVNTITDVNKRCKVGAEDRILGLSELHFDLSVYDIFGTLAAGGCLVLPAPSEKRDPEAWARLIVEEKVSIWNSVPALIEMLSEFYAGGAKSQNSNVNGMFSSLRWVLLSGDRIPLSLPDAIRCIVGPSVQILSLGGATETSIWSICYPITKVRPEWKSIPYGKAMDNHSVFVLDYKLRLCPTWVKGEIYNGGVGLAIGYWGDKERTSASFIFHPRTGMRLYRTGDFGRYLPDGNIEFLGREDDQVKLNGYRIELDEIKGAIMDHHLISDAIVSISQAENGTSHIAAFVRCNKNEKARKIDENVEDLYLYKKSQPGLRKISTGEMTIPLQPLIQKKGEYFERKSYRSFVSGHVYKSEIEDLLTDCFKTSDFVISQKPDLSLESLSNFLSPLSQLQNDSCDLPKYKYASAGSLYPVQIYLEVGENSVANLEQGFYYYNPLNHKLIKITSKTQPTNGLNIYLVGKHGSLEKVYGENTKLTEQLKRLNAGYLLGCLLKSTESGNTMSHAWNIMKASPEAQNLLRESIQLSERDCVLVNLKRGPQEQNEFVPAIPPISIALKQNGSKSVQKWITYKNQVFREAINTDETSSLSSLTGDAENIFGESAVAIFFHPDNERTKEMQLLQCGYWAHKIMSLGAKRGLGFCPLGNLPEIFTHGIFGGKISEKQRCSEEISSAWFAYDLKQLANRILEFTGTKIPAYMVPQRIQIVEQWPLTDNGKVDMKALKQIWLQQLQSDPQRVDEDFNSGETNDPLQDSILLMMKEILHLETCPIDGNFFRMGGNSIAAVKLVAAIRSKLGCSAFTVGDVFKNPDFKQLFGVVKKKLVLPTCNGEKSRGA